MRTLDPTSVTRHGGLGLMVLRTTEQRRCVFLGASGCSVHATRGAAFKPAICRRFPFGLVATPQGGRITTDHRCPCRSMGARPPIDLDDAARSLGDAGGRLRADLTAPATIPLWKRKRAACARYAAIEAAIMARMAADDDPLAALAAMGVAPLPELEEARWQDVAHLYRSHIDGTSCGEALAWFGDALLLLSGERLRSQRHRPWAPSFDRAEARAVEPEPAGRVLADWAQDVLWSLSWLEQGPLDRALVDVATRLRVAVDITERLAAAGARPDRAAAEALLVVELAGELPLWASVVASIKPGGEPTWPC
jgi:Fe-S-cluster containining protein